MLHIMCFYSCEKRLLKEKWMKGESEAKMNSYSGKVLCASWGVAQWIELWLLTTRAGVRIPVLTNAMHKFVELYALNQITLGVWCTPS